MGRDEGSTDEIERALDARDHASLAAAVDAFVRSDAPLEQADVERVCTRLRQERVLDHLVRVADAGLQRGLGGQLWSDLTQCMIEQGAYTAASAISERALSEEPLDAEHRIDLLGLTGRVSKDLYLSTGRPDDLRRALRSYADGFAEGDEQQQLWLGINVHSLARLAERRGIVVDPPQIDSEAEFFVRARKAAATGDPWAIATEIEANLLLGIPVDADEVVERLGDATTFVHSSLLRQLQQVWELPGTDPAVAALAEMLLSRGGAGEVVVAPDGYEKMFDGVSPIPLDTYQRGIAVARSVCRLRTSDRPTLGTGFVMSGDDLHPGFRGRQVVITNEHVIQMPERDGIRASEVVAHFEAADHHGIGGFRTVWWSDRAELDIAILVSDALADAPIEPLTPSPELPVVRKGAYVYVVGHASGDGLQLSIRGNELLDHDGRLVHYLAATDRGSSGSPVFDHSWRVIGTHHRGSPRLPALNDKPGTYKGNEGTSLLALKALLAERKPVL